MMGEAANVPRLLERLRSQTEQRFTLYCCVNRPDDDPTFLSDNERTLDLLSRAEGLDCRVIDRTTPGRGWQGKQRGVGWARKLLFDAIDADAADGNERVISLDADTDFDADYLSLVGRALDRSPRAAALAVPYFHPLTGQPTDRALLRYELYMRYYRLSLHLAASPYAFTAIGSALAFPLRSYRRVGGITPLPGGEDFYLMQKMAKVGSVLTQFAGFVRPQGRVSTRVPFGTGPAVALPLASQAERYPFYAPEAFEAVGRTLALFPALFEADRETPMSDFLRRQLRTDDLWQPLRSNFKSAPLFVRACHQRVDGLRTLQFLRHWRDTHPPLSDEAALSALWARLSGLGLVPSHALPVGFSLTDTPLEVLDDVRRHLFAAERALPPCPSMHP